MKRCGWLFRAIIHRAYLERVRCHRMSRMRVCRGFVSMTAFPPEERAAFIALIRGQWDGDERSLPHSPGCEVLFRDEDAPGPCTCGVTPLAQGRVLQAALDRLRWLGGLGAICSGWFWRRGNDQVESQSRPKSLSKDWFAWMGPAAGLIETFLQRAIPPYLSIRGLSGEVQSRVYQCQEMGEDTDLLQQRDDR